MNQRREKASLSGVFSQLICLGGQNFEILKVCETYLINLDKWTALPQLNRARYLPGSVVLQSKKAFCFCGIQETQEQNSIETLQLGNDKKEFIDDLAEIPE